MTQNFENSPEPGGKAFFTFRDLLILKQQMRATPKREEDSMPVNAETLKGKWQEIKGEVQKAYGRLTNDELEKTKGDLNQLAGLVKQKYGEVREDFEDKLTNIMNKFKEQKDRTSDDMSRKVANE